MSRNQLNFDECLEIAKSIHGNSCARLAIGTKMAIAGLKAIDINDPRGKDRSKVMVFVEIDRCVTDAIMAVTGCRPGQRNMRIVDYGKIAATFLNLETGGAVRLSIKDYLHDTVPADWAESRVKPFMGLPDRQLFHIEEVAVMLPPEDMPGRLLWVGVCERCGEIVMDMRTVRKGGRTLCRPCAKGTNYYAERQQAGIRRAAGSGHGRS